MKTRLDHVGLDVADYERSKAFHEQALRPLGMRLMMEPVPQVGGR
jgi:catechol 2,3-dioxygenase-like lactoylglutathione lyase family enzyme